MRIDRLAAGTLRPAQRKAGTGGFQVPEEPPGVGDSAAARGAAAVEAAGARDDGRRDRERDRQAERRADSALDALATLQLALLDGTADTAALQDLARLAEGEAGADPALAQVMAAIALRARVELARRRINEGPATGA